MNAYAIDTGSNTTVHSTTMAAHWPGAGIFDTAEGLAGIAPVYPYILFNKSPLQLRLIGARGGRAYGRNQRARRALMTTQPEVDPQRAALTQTTAEAVALLDAQFPWLRGAEQRRSGNAECKRTYHTALTGQK